MGGRSRQHGPPPQRIEMFLGHLLRTGVLVAAAVVAVGGGIYLARHGREPADYGLFRGEPAELRQLAGIWREAASLQGRGLIQLGLLVLIATPVMRVLAAGIAFAWQRDGLYVAVVLIVLSLLVWSLVS